MSESTSGEPGKQIGDLDKDTTDRTSLDPGYARRKRRGHAGKEESKTDSRLTLQDLSTAHSETTGCGLPVGSQSLSEGQQDGSEPGAPISALGIRGGRGDRLP